MFTLDEWVFILIILVVFAIGFVAAWQIKQDRKEQIQGSKYGQRKHLITPEVEL